jgi:hypothetical protein
MKISPRTIQGALLLLIMGFLIVAVVATRSVTVTNQELGAAAFYMQGTTTPEPTENVSEIGSTDGIVLMGVIIVLIVVVPILLRRKSWSSQ